MNRLKNNDIMRLNTLIGFFKMTELSTNWLRIGRSGATVDGRTIPPEALNQAAETYNPELFTALIWPEHQRWDNWGKVLSLKAQPNDEHGVDLYAQISPNRNYLGANTMYQEGLFTSMELTPNFRKTGKWYLSGLGATNEPASVGTTEIRFSKQAEQAGIFLSQAIATETKQFPDDRKDSFFKHFERFFSKNETETDNMTDQNYLQLKQELDAVKAKLATFSQQPAATPATPLNDDVVRLTNENQELQAQIEVFKTNDAKRTEEFTELKTRVETLSSTLSAALAEQPGTQGHANNGAAETAAKLA